jgi:hypothetical protein
MNLLIKGETAHPTPVARRWLSRTTPTAEHGDFALFPRHFEPQLGSQTIKEPLEGFSQSD